MSFCSFNQAVFANEESNSKIELNGTGTYYEYDTDTQTLTIGGEGNTPNFTSNGGNQPWHDYRGEIQKVVIKDGVTSLGSYFLYNVRASEIDLPSTLIEIGKYALSYTINVSEWDLPFGVKIIGSYAFSSNTNLVKINLPDTLTTISSYAFKGCSKLTKANIPYSVEAIGTYAFQNCTGLEAVEFDSLTSSVNIGANAFINCPVLTNVAIPFNATVGAFAFGYIDRTTKIGDIKFSAYKESAGYLYALANFGIDSITVYQSIPTRCAVGYSNTYTNLDPNEITYYTKSFTYDFTPQSTEAYSIYSRGECDIKATLSINGVTIAESDDISTADANFAISQTLIAGQTYQITISSNHMAGNYTLWIYPISISGFSASGKATKHDTAKRDMKAVDDSILENIVLNIQFENGLTDKIYYSHDYFDGRYIGQGEANLNCGESKAIIKIDDLMAEVPVFIDHAYQGVVIPYTVDTDGYTLYTCVLCKNDSYKDNYVPTPAIKIKGRAVFAENSTGDHDSNKPYPYISYVKVRDTKSIVERKYEIDEKGYFTVNTFNNISVTLVTEYGNKNATFSYKVDGLEPYTVVEYGDVAVNPYDFNCDYHINAKDYAFYVQHEKEIDDEEYMKFFGTFLREELQRFSK